MRASRRSHVWVPTKEFLSFTRIDILKLRLRRLQRTSYELLLFFLKDIRTWRNAQKGMGLRNVTLGYGGVSETLRNVEVWELQSMRNV